MAKKSVFIKYFTNQKGFIFPYLVFVATLVLFSVTASLTIYKNHLQMTELELDQIKLETLYQMGQTQFIQELVDLQPVSLPGQLVYTYPYGNVLVKYQPKDQINLFVEYHVSTNQGGIYGRSTTISMEQ